MSSGDAWHQEEQVQLLSDSQGSSCIPDSLNVKSAVFSDHSPGTVTGPGPEVNQDQVNLSWGHWMLLLKTWLGAVALMLLVKTPSCVWYISKGEGEDQLSCSSCTERASDMSCFSASPVSLDQQLISPRTRPRGRTFRPPRFA